MSPARSYRLDGRAVLVAVLAAGAGCLNGCRASGNNASPQGIMSYAAYRAITHQTPYVLDADLGDSRLVYYGTAHSFDPADPQAADIQRRWEALRPDFALNEGGDPPVEPTAEIAIGRHGEAGLLRWLAHRDGVPIRSLDPTREQEVAALSSRFTAEQFKVFYVLRWGMQDTRRAPEFRPASPEAEALRRLTHLSSIPGLEGAPHTLAEFESACRRLAPELTDWRTVPPSWFDPAPEMAASFTNCISRALSEYRDRLIVDTLEQSLRSHSRVFAAVGASHVVMQEPELRARFDRVRGPDGLLADAPVGATPVLSLLGKPLVPPAVPDQRRAELMVALVKYTERATAPDAAEDDFIWLGRTLAYLHRYHDAIDAYTRGLDSFPDSHRLLRHRGHRYITIRDFDRAGADLTAALALIDQRNIPDEVEPDGAPNRSGIPRSTTNTNILYHAALVHYLRADYTSAAALFQRCLDISPNDDMTVAAAHWLYMSLRRAGRDPAAALAPIHEGMIILENESYYRLCRMYQGRLTAEQVMPADATDEIALASTGYGVARWLAAEGHADEAAKLIERIASSPMWPAFGVIAAEADLARYQP